MPVYDHGVFEVPLDYGDGARMFERPNPQKACDFFVAYARSVCTTVDIEKIIAEVVAGD